jgi:hypothetical protein
MQNFNPFSGLEKRTGDVYDKERIGRQLDDFSQKFGLKSLRDRMRMGLNEVGLLAFEQTNNLLKEVIQQMEVSPHEAKRIYHELVGICVGMQQSGPWAYAPELAHPISPEMKMWFMMAGAETMGNEKGRELNPHEFVEDIKRIEGHLRKAHQDPEAFFQKAHEHLLKQSEETIRFAEGDNEKRVPIGEGFSAFLPMAIKGYEAGVVHDAEGWVYVGAKNEIEDERLESIGLRKVVGPDDRDPNRTVTFFVNDKEQRVIKKIHPGLLVVLSRSFDLAGSIVKALNEKQDVIDVATEALGHTRVVQTTEQAREDLGMEDQNMPEGFMRLSKPRVLSEVRSTSTELSRPREDFYHQLLNVRAMYVFMDALTQLKQKRALQGKPLADTDVDLLSRKTWDKMEQKIDELRHVTGLIREDLDALPKHIRRVVDMAGGAGDLGLAITTEILSRGKEVDQVEIVDPQEGVAEFMHTMIDHLPFRDTLEHIAVHNTGYLQDAKITPDTLVVAKHACGTLTDDILEQWRDSKSPMLVAMTCCQGKAAEHPARYGFSQKEWEQLCADSDLTNTQIPETPGKARDRALKRLEVGNAAMKKIDMARVEYLRRHGFKAELSTTDKFPKGDVIIARRLPESFMDRLKIIQELERNEPWKYETLMSQIDILAAGGKPAGISVEDFGAEWSADDFAELSRRFWVPAYEEYRPVNASERHVTAPNAGQEKPEAKVAQKKLMQVIFRDLDGRVDRYIQVRATRAGKKLDSAATGSLVEAIRNRIFRAKDQDPEIVRQGVDTMMQDMGY